MSRKLIIGFLILLIAAVVGGTVWLVVNRIRTGGQETQPGTQQPGSLRESETGSQQIVDPTGDSDNDGLSNADESIWGTDPNNPDTDSDGFQDGEEVAANRNPTIPSPNDRLPEGFEPGQNLAPLEPAASEAIAVDQFFAADLNVYLPDKNYTEEYRSQYSEAQRTSDTLAAYAQSQQIVTQLPQPDARAINVVSDGPQVSAAYRDAVGDLSIFNQTAVLEDIIDDLIKNGNTAPVRGQATITRIYQESLIEQNVPASAQNLHRLLLGYTELLAATYDQIAGYNEDPVKSIIAIRQLDEIQTLYPFLIEQELSNVSGI